MNKYDMIKQFYQKRLWDIARVRDAVLRNWLTQEEFKKITGKEYTESEDSHAD